MKPNRKEIAKGIFLYTERCAGRRLRAARRGVAACPAAVRNGRAKPLTTVVARRQDDPVTFIYEIECAKFRRLAFTIDFTGTANFSWVAARARAAAGAVAGI